MPSIDTGSKSPKVRPQKPSGGAQALTMILAWVGGAAAAVAAAFWILQLMKPPEEVKIAEAVRPAVREVDEQKRSIQKVERKINFFVSPALKPLKLSCNET